jgi:hypothetical protein
MFILKLLTLGIRIYRKTCSSSFAFSTRLDMLVKQKIWMGEVDLRSIHIFFMNLLVVFSEGIQHPQILGEFSFCGL